MNVCKRVVMTVLASLSFVTTVFASTSSGIRLKNGTQVLPAGLPNVSNKRGAVTYNFDLGSETFYVLIPSSYTGSRPFGLVVFMSPSDECDIPDGWKSTLKKRNLIYIAPQKAGNKQPTSRRCGLAVVAAAKITELLNIDKDRVFISGFSGGGRIACMTAFYHPSLFAGCFPICGAQFFEHVERKHATKNDDYGYFGLQGGLSETAKARLRFALITGTKDFRHGNILDLYHGGFHKQGLTAKLIDVRGMAHELCSQRTLEDALQFIDQKRAPVATADQGKPITPATNARIRRTWTNLSGTTLEAELTKVVGSQVYLKRPDGKTIMIRLSQLSREDRIFIGKAQSR